MIKFNANKAYGFINEEAVKGYKQAVAEAQEALHNGTGKGNDFLGWLTLPTDLTDELLTDIENVANTLRRECEVVVVVGIGGSYLGAKAVIDALNNSFDWLQRDRKNPVVVYAGQNIGEDYLYELQEMLKGKRFDLHRQPQDFCGRVATNRSYC